MFIYGHVCLYRGVVFCGVNSLLAEVEEGVCQTEVI